MFATPAILPRLRTSGLFSDADLYQARFAASLVPAEYQSLTATLTALLSLAVRDGHVCLDLDDLEVQKRFAEIHPDQAGLREMTAQLLETQAVGAEEDPAPMVLHGHRLYFRRFFHDERQLANAILRMAAHPPQMEEIQLDLSVLAKDQPDWQEVAAFAALRSRFCVISGGPGTGKTHTVAKVLHRAAAMHAGEHFVISLAAPTGKAAGRMNESLAKAFPDGYPPELTACITKGAQTVHRLLGSRSDGTFRHGPDNPLPLHMLVVDEVSMLDVELAARLLEALPEHASLVLLGDRGQLASVEAGAVLANLCLPGDMNRFSAEFAADLKRHTGYDVPVAARPARLTDHMVELRHSFRFATASGIGRLSAKVRDGQAQEAGRVIEEEHPDLFLRPCAGPAALHKELTILVRTVFRNLTTISDPAQAFTLFDSLRFLSPVRRGPRGTETLNALIRDILGTREDWYAGRPVMVLENDYNAELFNGDTGLTLPTPDGLRVFFPGSDGFRSFSPARLPRHETCYAMTVHKSQGSEFEHTVLVLPKTPCPILSRELLYTALTRAKKCFTLIGTAQQVVLATQTPVRRDSGLSEMLWPENKNQMQTR